MRALAGLAIALAGALLTTVAGADTPLGGGGRIVFASDRASASDEFFGALPVAHARATLLATTPPDAVLSPNRGRYALGRFDRSAGGRLIVGTADGTAREAASSPYFIEAGAWSPDGRTIAYTVANTSYCRPGDHACAVFELWTVRADGTGNRQVDGRGAVAPVWSPNGRWLAYVGEYSTYDDAGKLWVARGDGSGRRRLSALYGAHSLSWSPQSTRIAFVQAGRGRIAGVAASGSRAIGIADGVMWSPDGRRLAVVRPNIAGRVPAVSLWVERSDGTGARRIATSLSIPEVAWAPAHEIAYLGRPSRTTGETVLVVLRPDGRRARTVLRVDGRSDLSDLAWARSGKRVLYRQTHNPGDLDLFTIAADGTDLRRLTDDAAVEEDPAWSPDAAQIIFARARQNAPQSLELVTIPAGGGRVKTLTTASAGVYDRWPAWAPDGATIVFSRSVGSDAFASELYLVDPAGTSTGQLTHLDGANTSPAWSPDGTRIAFAHFGGSVLGDGIFSIRRDGTDVRLLTDQASAFDPAWSPDGSRIAFESAGEGGTYLYLVGAAGGPAVRVPVQVGDFSRPSWSPDGSRIAYEAPDGDVHSVAADGSGDVDLTSSPGSDESPSWSRASG